MGYIALTVHAVSIILAQMIGVKPDSELISPLYAFFLIVLRLCILPRENVLRWTMCERFVR
jgi:hypothetical protein